MVEAWRCYSSGHSYYGEQYEYFFVACLFSDIFYFRYGFLVELYISYLEFPFQFVAGFGKGGTSIPFWETVYGFNMSCIGKELAEDAARVPIVDVIDSGDIVTNTVVLQVSTQCFCLSFVGMLNRRCHYLGITCSS